MTVPFAGLGEAGVNARVALALLKLMCKDKVLRGTKPAILIGVASARLDGLHFGMVRLALLSLNHWVLDGGRSDAWLKHVLYCDAMGYSFRRAFYADYKVNRR
jgi:hypothetical protein